MISNFSTFFHETRTATLWSLMFACHMAIFHIGTMFLGFTGLYFSVLVLSLFVVSLTPIFLTLLFQLKNRRPQVNLEFLVSLFTIVIVIWFSVSGLSLAGDVRTYHLPKIFFALSEGTIHLSSFTYGRANVIFSSYDYYLAPYILIFKNPFAISLPNAISLILIFGLIIDIFEELEFAKLGALLAILALALNPLVLYEVIYAKNHIVSALMFTLLFALWARARKDTTFNPSFSIALFGMQISGLMLFAIKSLAVIPAFFAALVLIVDLVWAKYKANNKPQIFRVFFPQIVIGSIGCLLVIFPTFFHMTGAPEQKSALLAVWVNKTPNFICSVEMMNFWIAQNLSDLKLSSPDGIIQNSLKECKGDFGEFNFWDLDGKTYVQNYFGLIFWFSIPISLILLFRGQSSQRILFFVPFLALFIFEAIYRNHIYNFRIWIIYVIPIYCVIGCLIVIYLGRISYAFLAGFFLIFGSNFLEVNGQSSKYKFENAKLDLGAGNDGQVNIAISTNGKRTFILDNLFLIMDDLDWDWGRVKFGQFNNWPKGNASGWGKGDDERFTHHLQCGTHLRLLENLRKKTPEISIQNRPPKGINCELTPIIPKE